MHLYQFAPSARNDGTQKRINPNEPYESEREALPLPARHGKRRRSNPEHNTMTQVGAVSIKDEKQEKDGHTAGLLR
ncbi:MAG: hypothetical protein RR206_07730, partial [Bacteroidaceae bacterium]